MKKYLIISLLIFSFNNLFAVDKEYVPESSVLVVSSKIDNISQKAGKTTKDLLNNLLFNKLATNFSEYRRDERVSYTFQNDIVDLLDFKKDSKMIMLNTLNIAVIADVSNLEKLDLIMIRIALEESIDIVSGDGLTFRYLELDDTISFAWNKDVFVVITSVPETPTTKMLGYKYGATETLSNFDAAKLIFSKKTYRKDKTLLDMYNKKNDMLAWLDTYYWYEYSLNLSSLYVGIASMPEDNSFIKNMYKDSSVVVSMDFLSGKMSTVINSYYPNMPLDDTKLKKPLDNAILTYVNDTGMIGFMSLAFKADELGKMIDLMIKYMWDSSVSEQLETLISTFSEMGIKNYEDLLKLFGGDVFVYASASDKSLDEAGYLMVLSIKDKQRVLEVLEILFEVGAEDKAGGKYFSINLLITDLSIFIKDNFLYIGNEASVDNVINNKPVTQIAKYKMDMINNKTMVVYIDLNYLLKSQYFSGMSDIFENLYFTAEYISKTESKASIEVNFLDKNKNSLEIIYNLLTVMN